MQFIDNLGFRSKLFLLSGITGAVLVAAIAFILYEVQLVGRETRQLSDVNMPAIERAAAISQLRLRYRVRSLEYMLSESADERVTMVKSLDSLNTLVTKAIADYRPLIADAGESAMVDQIDVRARAYANAVDEARTRVEQGDILAAQQLRRTVWVERADALRDAVDALVKLNKERGNAAALRAAAEIERAFVFGVGAAIVGLLLAAVLTLVISTRVCRRLSDTVETVSSIAGGDLTTTMPAITPDEIGKLVRSVSEMQSALHTTISRTRSGADQVAQSSRQLKDSASQVSQSASVQSSAASAIAANVEELTVSITHVSERTSDAARLAGDSNREAQEGKQTIDRLVTGIDEMNTVVAEVVTRITSLEKQSEQISRIVSVIREVAEQTNLLALNAAIEAARAGEAGRGFAVVADEVRKLSERTAQSTREIATMVDQVQVSTRAAVSGIERGVSSVHESRALAGHAGETISRLQTIARNVADILVDLDLALREQSTASAEVARRVEDIAAHSEETSSATAQSVASAQALDTLAAKLLEGVQRFRV